jgi:hypothetical protein
MKPTRVIAVVLLSFLLGGGSAEVAVQTHRALHRRAPEVGSAGDLVAFEVRGEGGELIARPRVIASPGRPAHMILRDPLDPDRIRLELRVEATREISGEVSLDYQLSMPEEDLACGGRLSTTPGVEQNIDVGDRPLTAKLMTLPVPSAAFDAFLEAERLARRLS